VGQLFSDAPAVTLTAGHAAFHEALFGDRLRLPLDAVLCEKVTGSVRALVHPNVICNIAIGQTTSPTQRVKGNLFYRGLILHQPVFVGDTLRTSTKIVALKQNSQFSSATPCALRRKLSPSSKTVPNPDVMPPEWRPSRFT